MAASRSSGSSRGWASPTFTGRSQRPGPAGREPDEKALWTAALAGADSLAAAALDRYCLILGAVAGDLALTHARRVVIAGASGCGWPTICRFGFSDRFIAKGRFERHMDALPVKLLTTGSPACSAPPRLSRSNIAELRALMRCWR